MVFAPKGAKGLSPAQGFVCV